MPTSPPRTQQQYVCSVCDVPVSLSRRGTWQHDGDQPTCGRMPKPITVWDRDVASMVARFDATRAAGFPL